MAKDFEITTSARGFEHYGSTETAYRNTVSVYESSAASGPHLWLSIDDDATAHMTLEQAKEIRDRLDFAIRRAGERWDWL